MNEGAVSVVAGKSGLDDFPVLKAFQQYVDAEQSKAHRRLMSVCVFFTALLFAVSGGFLIVLFGMDGKETRAEAALRAMTESNAVLQKQLFEQTVKFNESMAAQAHVDAAVSASAAEAELMKRNMELQTRIGVMEAEKRLREEFEKSKREAEAAAVRVAAGEAGGGGAPAGEAGGAREARLRAREERLAADERRLRELERDLHKRRMYPGYYAKTEETPSKAGEAAEAGRKKAEAEQYAKDAEELAKVVEQAERDAKQEVRESETEPAEKRSREEFEKSKREAEAAGAPAKPADDDLDLFDEVLKVKPEKKPAKLDVGGKAGSWVVPLE